MGSKAIFLLTGLVLGGLAGYVTRPESAEIKVGPVSIEVKGDQPARGGGVTSGQWQHVGLFAGGGAVLGLLAGFAVGGRRA